MARVKIGNVFPGVAYLLKHCAPAVVQVQIPINKAVSFTFDAGTHTALIACRTTKKDNYSVFLYSGYGNGGIRSNVDVLCAMDSNVTYGIMEATSDGTGATNGVTLWNRNTTYIDCTIFPLLGGKPTVVDGDNGTTESPFKWVNPPMNVGEEYCTTEFFNGKPVYTKLVNCDYLPNAESKIVAHGCAAVSMIRCCGITSLGTTIPYRWNDSYVSVSADRTNIHLCTNSDFSSQTCKVQLWYTKN